MIGGVIPKLGVANNLPVWHLHPYIQPTYATAFLGIHSSLIFDYVGRFKIGGNHLNFFLAEQLPVAPPSAFATEHLSFISARVLKLTYTSYEMRPWSEDLGHHGPPFAWDEDRRAQLRADLDAFFAIKYGLSRDELVYVLDPAKAKGSEYPSETFRVLRNNEIAHFGEYRTERLALAAFDRLTGS